MAVYYIEIIKMHPEFRDAFVYHRYLPPRKPVYGPQLSFHNEILKSMKQLGPDRLYGHQVEAIQHLRQGANVLVAGSAIFGGPKSIAQNVADFRVALA